MHALARRMMPLVLHYFLTAAECPTPHPSVWSVSCPAFFISLNISLRALLLNLAVVLDGLFTDTKVFCNIVDSEPITQHIARIVFFFNSIKRLSNSWTVMDSFVLIFTCLKFFPPLFHCWAGKTCILAK